MKSEDLYVANGFLRNLYLCFNIVFAQLGCITRTRNKFVEIVAALERYLIKIFGINEAAVPDIPFRKISWWKNVNKKGKSFFARNLQNYQFEQDGWKNKVFVRKSKLNMN